MTYDELIDYFGSQGKAAHALGLSQPSVWAWKESGVPPLRQIQAEELSRGKIKADPDVYEKLTKRARAA